MSEAVELELSTAPFIDVKKNTILQDGDLFYGTEIKEHGLKEILQRVRKDRNTNLAKALEYNMLFGYEGNKLMGDGKILPILYQVMPSPGHNDIYDDYLYPVAVWNITLAALDGVSHKPTWIQQPVLDSAGNPIYITGHGRGRARTNVQLVAYHFIVINDRYVPQIIDPQTGKTDDGKWTHEGFMQGSRIREILDAEVNLGLNKLSNIIR